MLGMGKAETTQPFILFILYIRVHAVPKKLGRSLALPITHHSSRRYFRHLHPALFADGFLGGEAEADGLLAGDGVGERGLARP